MDVYVLVAREQHGDDEILDVCSSLRLAEELKEEYESNDIIKHECIIIEKRPLLIEP